MVNDLVRDAAVVLQDVEVTSASGLSELLCDRLWGSSVSNAWPGLQGSREAVGRSRTAGCGGDATRSPRVLTPRIGEYKRDRLPAGLSHPLSRDSGNIPGSR